uniref:Uncharacterized protein n=1 Tax=Manihot esculenta TaxID=3983 RepID=A0A2C9VDU6_MANES
MIGHAPWNGCNLADYVNGLLSVSTCDGLIAIPLALKQIRWCGVLQNCFCLPNNGAGENPYRTHKPRNLSPGRFSMFKLYCWLVGACVLVVYLCLIYGTCVPDKPLVPLVSQCYLRKC